MARKAGGSVSDTIFFIDILRNFRFFRDFFRHFEHRKTIFWKTQIFKIIFLLEEKIFFQKYFFWWSVYIKSSSMLIFMVIGAFWPLRQRKNRQNRPKMQVIRSLAFWSSYAYMHNINIRTAHTLNGLETELIWRILLAGHWRVWTAARVPLSQL